MYDPRWDDARERDDGRARVYGERDRADHDPRHGLMYDLDLPRGDARELVIDRDRLYELNGEDSRMLATIGAFRAVPEQDLGTDRDSRPDYDTLDHLRDEGLIRTIALGEHERAVVLTNEGRDLLDANRRDRGEGESQTFYAGVNRPRELDHDAHLYAAYREEKARLRHYRPPGAVLSRVSTGRQTRKRPVGRVPHQGVPAPRGGAVRQPVSSLAAHGGSHSPGGAIDDPPRRERARLGRVRDPTAEGPVSAVDGPDQPRR